MARKPNQPVAVEEPNLNHDQIAADHAALNEVARMNAEASDNAHALAVQFGYQGSMTVGAVEDEIRFYQRCTAEAVMELGKRLLILRELTPHGEFGLHLDMLGFAHRTAQKFMASALKFSNTYSNTLLKAAGSQTKLLELLVLDDGEIDALERGESVRGVNLDKIETMSVRELKAALREKQANEVATDRVMDGLQKANTKLKKELAGKQIDPHTEWSEAMRGLNAHVAAHKSSVVEYVTALDVIREKVMEQVAEPGAEAALEQARAAIGHELAQAIVRIEEQVAAVKRKFEMTLGALID